MTMLYFIIFNRFPLGMNRQSGIRLPIHPEIVWWFCIRLPIHPEMVWWFCIRLSIHPEMIWWFYFLLLIHRLVISCSLSRKNIRAIYNACFLRSTSAVWIIFRESGIKKLNVILYIWLKTKNPTAQAIGNIGLWILFFNGEEKSELFKAIRHSIQPARMSIFVIRY